MVFVTVIVEVVVVDAVNEVVTVEVFSVFSLLPLTVIVVTVFPSGDTTVFVCEKSFLLIFFSYFIILKHTVFEFISGAKYSKYTVPETVLLIDSWTDQAAIDEHHASPMMKQLAELRDKYDLHMTVERFISDEYEADKKYIRT